MLGRIRPTALGCAAIFAGAGALFAAPALASQDPANDVQIRSGNHILVVHNIDFVGAFGDSHTPGETMSVDVFRGDHRIAHAAGPAVTTPDGPGLEVNHGPAGAAQPGDCWDTVTPDIKPGDKVVVTDSSGTDSTYVDEISITSIGGDAPIDPLVPEVLLSDDVLVEGEARNVVTGAALPAALLDSGAWRTTAGADRRGGGPAVTVAGDGAYTARYTGPGYGIERGGSTIPKADVLSAGHEFGYGHALVPLPAEIQLVEASAGQLDNPGPAIGCESAPAAAANAITTSNDPAVNLKTLAPSTGPGDFEGLELGGVATGDTSGVDVTLSDGTTTIDATVTIGTSDLGNFGGKGFTARFDAAALGTLADGPLTATATFSGGTGPVTATRTIAKDTLAPGAPTATPAAGSYTATQFVTLASPGAARVRYTQNGADPALGGQAFGGSIGVSTSRTIRAVGIDAAGNVGPEASFAYTITAPPSGGGGNPGTGGGNAAGGGAARGAGAQAAAAAPVIGALAAPAPAPAAGVAGEIASSTAPLALRRLTLPARIKRGAIRSGGLRLTVQVNDGTRVVRVRVYRRKANGFRTLVAEAFRTPTRAGLLRIRLDSRRIRSALSVGGYEIEVTPGTSRRALGRTSWRTFRVIR
ncbi:MAG: hypothetical protein QOD81_3754 [Solirubrobacteraceae bacterium]|nr:hypothetical protein [Solirubrobacteraceae bacterium]